VRGYGDVDEHELVFSADRSRAASIVRRDRDDVFDSDSYYDIELWDCASRSLICRYTRTYSVGAGGESGKPVAGVEFDARGELWIRFGDGSRETAEEPPLPLPSNDLEDLWPE
jgi:hypothetical protein